MGQHRNQGTLILSYNEDWPQGKQKSTCNFFNTCFKFHFSFDAKIFIAIEFLSPPVHTHIHISKSIITRNLKSHKYSCSTVRVPKRGRGAHINVMLLHLMFYLNSFFYFLYMYFWIFLEEIYMEGVHIFLKVNLVGEGMRQSTRLSWSCTGFDVFMCLTKEQKEVSKQLPKNHGCQRRGLSDSIDSHPLPNSVICGIVDLFKSF